MKKRTKAKSTYSDKVRDQARKRLQNHILKELGYRSLDAFALENSDYVSKATLYEFCRHGRDIRLSSLADIAKAAGISLEELFQGL